MMGMLSRRSSCACLRGVVVKIELPVSVGGGKRRGQGAMMVMVLCQRCCACLQRVVVKIELSVG